MQKKTGAAVGRGRAAARPRTLAIDVGGTGLKASVLDPHGVMITDRLRVPTPSPAPPTVLVDALVELVAPIGGFERVSVGFPGVVRDGRVLTAPHFGTKKWHRFDLTGALAKRLGTPVRLINDAEMQGLAVIRGTRLELVVTLGTGVGTALFRDGELMPHLELAHHPVHGRKTYNEYLGDRARKKTGARRWNRRVRKVMDILQALLNYDRVYLGGGNARRVTFDLDRNMRRVSNDAGMLGGIALWRDSVTTRRSRTTGSHPS